MKYAPPIEAYPGGEWYTISTMYAVLAYGEPDKFHTYVATPFEQNVLPLIE